MPAPRVSAGKTFIEEISSGGAAHLPTCAAPSGLDLLNKAFPRLTPWAMDCAAASRLNMQLIRR